LFVYYCNNLIDSSISNIEYLILEISRHSNPKIPSPKNPCWRAALLGEKE